MADKKKTGKGWIRILFTGIGGALIGGTVHGLQGVTTFHFVMMIIGVGMVASSGYIK